MPNYERNSKAGCEFRYYERLLCSFTRYTAAITVSRASLNDTSRPVHAFVNQTAEWCLFLFRIIPEIITCSTETLEIIISFKRNCANRHIFISYDRTLLTLIFIIHRAMVTVKDKVRPRTGHEGPEREQTHSSTLSLTSALHRVGIIMGYLI